MSIHIAINIDVPGLVEIAQHYGDPQLLRATLPELTDEMAFAIVDGHATLTQEGRRLTFRPNQVH